jgi:hypothetical protein
MGGELMYQKRMFGYYPPVIQTIVDFKAIIDSEYPEFEGLAGKVNNSVNESYLSTMSEERTKEWEQILGITPVPASTLQDRRETIIARIRGQGKLNTAMINTIVNTFTGGTAKSMIKGGILYVEIDLPSDNKEYIFENVEQELLHKIPAHLALRLNRNYLTWLEVDTLYATWQNVKDNFDNWEEVLFFSPFEEEGA